MTSWGPYRQVLAAVALAMSIAPHAAAAQQVDRSPERNLAIIEFGYDMPDNDPRVLAFGVALDTLAAECPEARVTLADLTAGTQKVMADRGVNESPSTILASVIADIDGDRVLPTCQDYFVGHALLRLGGA